MRRSFSQEELAAKAHNYELERCESNVICVDYAMAGVGSSPADQGLRRNISLKAFDKRTFSYSDK